MRPDLVIVHSPVGGGHKAAAAALAEAAFDRGLSTVVLDTFEHAPRVFGKAYLAAHLAWQGALPELYGKAYFGANQRMVSIRGAVSYLGVELLKGLVLASSTFAAAENLSVEGFSLERLRSSSLLAARSARRFIADKGLADEAFTTGLVHDVGKIVIALGLPGEFSRVVRESEASGRGVHLLEKEAFGVSHAEVGAYLLGVWGLPFTIVEAVAYHHQPGLIQEGPCVTLALLHAADAFVEAGGAGLDMAFLSRAGFAAQAPRWQEIVAEETAAAGAVA